MMANAPDTEGAGRGARASRSLDVGAHTGAIHLDALLDLLERLAEEGGVIELMCHPADPDAALLKGSTYAEDRGIELDTLTHPRVRATVDRLGIELANYSAL